MWKSPLSCWFLCWSSWCCWSSPRSTCGGARQVGRSAHGPKHHLLRRPLGELVRPGSPSGLLGGLWQQSSDCCWFIVSAARVIYEVPHCDSEPAEVDQCSGVSSPDSSQWVSGLLQGPRPAPGPRTPCSDRSSVSSSVRCRSTSPLITLKVCSRKEPSEELHKETFSLFFSLLVVFISEPCEEF